VVGGEGGQPDPQGLLLGAAQQHEGDQVVVPDQDEGEDRGGDQPRGDQGEQDAPERPGAGAAVDHRRLLELLGDVDDEAAQGPDAERQHEGQVGDDDPGQPVGLAGPVQRQVDGDDEGLQGHHLDHDQHDDQDGPAPEAEPGRGQGGQEGQGQGDEHRHHDHGHAVADVLEEVRLADGGAVVLQRPRDGQPSGLERQDVDAPLEAGGHHPVDGEQRHQQHQHGGGVVADPDQPAAGHGPTAFSIWRT
jgi:hypothetical protein